jgi:hypothetical protein
VVVAPSENAQCIFFTIITAVFSILDNLAHHGHIIMVQNI